MKKCVICGSISRSKYCSQQCYRESERRKYREKHPKIEKFYVFYDNCDFVRFFGTAKQLVEDGIFPSLNAVSSYVSKLKSGAILNGSVFILNCKEEV